MRGDTHVRFGRRARETDPGQPGHRARARPNRSDTRDHVRPSDHRWSATQARLLAPHRPTSGTPQALRTELAVRSQAIMHDRRSARMRRRMVAWAWLRRRRRIGADPPNMRGGSLRCEESAHGVDEQGDPAGWGPGSRARVVGPADRHRGSRRGQSRRLILGISERGRRCCASTGSWPWTCSTRLAPRRRRCTPTWGGHTGVPPFEGDDGNRLLARHLK